MENTQINYEELSAHIETKEEILLGVAARLKTEFIGLDNVIDQMIDNIKIWYIFPELQLRPTIICLWGLTGVGKTDLVRKLISYLKIQDRFLEIEMSENKDSGSTIQNKLEASSINPEDQCVVFLDEFQKFRTINSDGTTNQNQAYPDVWTLLSDGKFHADLTRKTELVEQLLYSKYYNDYYTCEIENSDAKKEQPKTPEKKKRERTYNTSVYLARKVKRLFKLPESMEDIMKWDSEKICSLYDSFNTTPQIYEGDAYKKMLIIISGNLDEAYKIADDVSESDLDADYYHEVSKKLTIVDIKNALRYRFRPEQIARLGNSHILYPSLSKENYYKIIQLKCAEINNMIKEIKGIDISYDNSVYDVIYNNGVFPTQGVRPLLSTTTNILSTGLPKFIFTCLLNKVSNITIRVDKNIMSATIGDTTIEVTIPTVLDKIRSDINSDVQHSVAVHELGHAIIYALLTGVAPDQICVKSTSSYNNGFVLPHSTIMTKGYVLKFLQIALAGRAAEEIVFGDECVSSGAYHDIATATSKAWAYVCRWGFDKHISAVTQKLEDGFVRDEAVFKEKCDTMLDMAKQSAINLIYEHIKLYKELLGSIIKNGKITIDEFISVFNSYGIQLSKVEIGNTLLIGYEDSTINFLNNDVTQYVPVVHIDPIPEKETIPIKELI